MNNNSIFSEENIILAPPTKLLDEAKEISLNTIHDEKFPFVLHYNPNQKNFLLSLLGALCVIVEEDNEECHTISTWMNMTQLAFIKHSNCIERVKTDEGINPFLAEDAVDLSAEAPAGNVVQETIVVSPEAQNEIATPLSINATSEAITFDGSAASVAASVLNSYDSHPANTDMAHAQVIYANSTAEGCICCPGFEQWFKFTAPASKKYTICTVGDLDTVGTLCDCYGDPIVEVDDYEPCGKIDFRIIRNLTSGNIYYIKVGTKNNEVGNYTLRVTDSVLANSVNINKTSITLEKGVRYELPITPNYTYKRFMGARPIPELSVSINPSNATEQKIWWWEQYGSILECSYGWDDDGDRYIHVTATGIGTAKLFAQDWKSHGKRDECEVTCNSPSTDSVPEHSHIYNAVVSEDRNEYTFTCTASQCNDSFTVPKDQVIGSYVTSSTNPHLGDSQTPLAYGIDVSYHQGEISQSKWNEIANTQIDGYPITFVILRIGREVSNNADGSINRKIDEQFENNYERAKAAGLHVGCYYYTESLSPQNAIGDAEQVIEWIGNKQLEYPVFFDIESNYILDSNNVPNNTVRTEICTAFMNKMREAGFFAGLYANNNWITNYLSSSTLFPEYDFWYARYYDNTPNDWQSNWAGTGKKFGMWQYTESKNIAPISGNIDCNVAYKNYPLIIKALHLNNFN